MAGPTDDVFAARPEDVPIDELSEARILGIMARCLQQRTEHPVGSKLWAIAVLDYDECKRELDRRLHAHLVAEIQKRQGTDRL